MEKMTTMLKTVEIDEIIDLAMFKLNFGITNLLVSGRVESWDMIIDLDNVGVSDIPLGKVKAFVGAATKRFAGRSFKMYIVNASFMVRGIFSVVTSMVDEFTTSKMKMCGSDFTKTVHT
jgi:hypothetical protein